MGATGINWDTNKHVRLVAPLFPVVGPVRTMQHEAPGPAPAAIRPGHGPGGVVTTFDTAPRGDLIGFGDAGVYFALSNGNGTFQPARLALANFATQQGWRVDEHPRFVADVTGDKRADLVGFGDAGVYVAVSDGDGTFQPATLVVGDLGVQQGWQVGKHPRFVADVTGDGRADVIGFGDAGVYVALSNGDGTFAAPHLAVTDFGTQQGWQVDKHPRFVADITGHGRADVVGFGDAGVYVALSNGDGTFGPVTFTLNDFGDQSGTAGVAHLFVLMLENRSFDHMLGFSPITGTDAVTGNPTATIRLTGTESNQTGGVDFTVATGAKDSLDFDPGHEFEDAVVQLGGPGSTYPSGGPYPPIVNTGFADSYRAQVYDDQSPTQDPEDVMRGYAPEHLPILNQLAQEFAVCDQWFSALPGPTWPNRFFTHAASSGGLDHSPSTSEIIGWQVFDGFDFPKGSIYDAMDKANVSYRFYAGDDFPVVSGLSGVSLSDINDFTEDFVPDLAGSDFGTVRYVLIEPSYDVTGSYRGGNSQHPSGDVLQGEQLIKAVYEAIRNSPVWNDSMLIITWDEHGGFFDHCHPPATIPPNDGPPTDEDYTANGFLFDQLGVRVPAVVVSPHIPKNVIDHRVYEHSSIPATIERLFGVDPLTDRDRNANSPAALLTLMQPRTDTPATLGTASQSGSTRSGPVAAPVHTPAELAQPIGRHSLAGFLLTAAVQELKMTKDPAQRKAIVAKVSSMSTRGEALGYMGEVAARTSAVKGTARAGRGSGQPPPPVHVVPPPVAAQPVPPPVAAQPVPPPG